MADNVIIGNITAPQIVDCDETKMVGTPTLESFIENGKWYIKAKYLKGIPGTSFSIARTFSSMAQMVTSTGIAKDAFVLINEGSDRGKLYQKTAEADEADSYTFLANLQGIKGDKGDGITSATIDVEADDTRQPDATVELQAGETTPDGANNKTLAITLKNIKGDKGDGVTNATIAVATDDTATPSATVALEGAEVTSEGATNKTLAITLKNIKGDKGDKGDTGEQGIQGIKGDKGDKGDTGVSIATIAKTATNGLTDTYTITLENGATETFTVTNGAKGDKGDAGTTTWADITDKPDVATKAEVQTAVNSIPPGTSVKGNAETAYRTGEVNLTPANIGASPSNHSHAWDAITDKPSTFTPASHTHTIANVTNLQSTLDGKASSGHTHTTLNVGNKGSATQPVYFSNGAPTVCNSYPTALKNPASLTVQFNGTNQTAYDGSTARTYNITPSAIGAAASSHIHGYLPLSGGMITGALTFTGSNVEISRTGNGVLNLHGYYGINCDTPLILAGGSSSTNGAIWIS